jgi:hypothetical protein
MTSHYIILTVAIIYQDKKGIPNRYALQLSLRDKETIGEASELSIKIDNQEISLQKSLKAYNNHGRLTNPLINKWIKDKSIHSYKPEVKIIFRLEKHKNIHRYIIYQNQANIISANL